MFIELYLANNNNNILSVITQVESREVGCTQTLHLPLCGVETLFLIDTQLSCTLHMYKILNLSDLLWCDFSYYLDDNMHYCTSI